MYAFESRVRFSEIDTSERLTLPALVNYFQDCSIFQSEELGLGIDSLKEKKRAWVLTSWQIEVERYPRIGEWIRTGTWATGFEGAFGHRNFQMTDKDGKTVAWANSLWVFMDIGRGRPVKPSEEDIGAYAPEPPLKKEFASRKILLPKESTEGKPFPVLKCQIDTNDHVNNCQYIQMALEILPECARAEKIRAEYKKSAVAGDWIAPRTSVEADRTVVELCSTEDGKTFAVVEFK